MSTNSRKRRGLKIARRNNLWAALGTWVRGPENWFRVQLLVVTGAVLWAVSGGWSPPFPYRVRMVPERDLYARVEFQYQDAQRTRELADKASRNVPCFYENDASPLDDLRSSLIEKIFQLKDLQTEEVNWDTWREFYNAGEDQEIDAQTLQQDFEEFKDGLARDDGLTQLRHSVDMAFYPLERDGLLTTLQHNPEDGSMDEIKVVNRGATDTNLGRRIDTADVRIAIAAEVLQEKLLTEIRNQSNYIGNPELVARRIFHWLRPRLPVTLKYNDRMTSKARRMAAESVETQYRTYAQGDPLEKLKLADGSSGTIGSGVIGGGLPLDDEDIRLLKTEHRAYVKQMDWLQLALHVASDAGMYIALLGFLVLYLHYRDPALIQDTRRFSTFLGLFLFASCTAWLLAAPSGWRAEIVPLTFFSMTVAIALHREIAVVMSAVAALMFTLSHGYGMTEFVVLATTTSTAGLLCGAIRSRTRLIYVGLSSAAVAFPTVIGASLLAGQPLIAELGFDALWFGSGAILAGVLMTALLPWLERWFDLETDISLLELSDANHPLLRELVQRAPGTYNHSINVASIAEAAAKSIGANGLLCRVGAYFHDIGKMRKPEYFIENQAGSGNKHDDLLPSMSTLVIISHVKDGVELARSHRLPTRIIDLIEQHHGNTLVEYFYNLARKQQGNPENDVEKSDFRYPGPKPQSREAAVMMIADAVESASRTLREPAPARLEALVSDILKKKLDDGQFDECPVTMSELNQVRESLVKSLNAIYHARIQYDEAAQAAAAESTSEKGQAAPTEPEQLNGSGRPEPVATKASAPSKALNGSSNGSHSSTAKAEIPPGETQPVNPNPP